MGKKSGWKVLLVSLLGATLMSSGSLESLSIGVPQAQAAAQAEAYVWDNVNIGGGGYATSILIHPAEKDLMYARSDVGGVFRWDNALHKWIPLMDSIAYLDNNLVSVDGIAIDPGNTNVIYAAAGGSKWDYATKTNDLLRSADRGKTWKRTNLNKAFFGNEDWRWNGEPIAVDPNNSNIVFVGTRLDGLYKTNNAAASTITWVQASGIPTETYDWQNIKGVRSVVFDKNTAVNGVTQTIYASAMGRGIYRSTNGGASFSLIADSPTNTQRLAVAPNGTLYATYSGGVKKLVHNVWYDINPGSGNFNGLSVHPTNSDILAVARNNNSTWNDIYYSTNGGSSWTNVTNKSDPYMQLLWKNKGRFSAATTQVVLDPHDPKKAWITDYYSTFYTPDITASKVQWFQEVWGYETTVAFSMISPPSGAPLITGVADVDGMRHEELNQFPRNGHNYLQETTGLDFLEADPNYIARVGSWGWGNNGSGLYSEDNGVTWKEFATFPTTTRVVNGATQTYKRPGGRIAVSATKDASTNKPTLIVVPVGGTKPYRSTDNGTTWTEIADLPSGGVGSFWDSNRPIASDRVNGSKFYFYKDGKVYRSENRGSSWTHVNAASVLPSKGAHYIKAAPDKEGEVWVSLNDGGLYRSSNGGTSFNKIAGVHTAVTFGFGKAKPGVNNPSVYVQGKLTDGTWGLFRSTDMGATWLRISTDTVQASKDPKDLEGSRQTYGLVFVGSGGRGYYYGMPSGGDTTAPSAPTGLTSTAKTDLSVNLSWTASGSSDVKGYDIFRNGWKVGYSKTNSFVDSFRVLPSTAYTYTLRAYDQVGNYSPPSAALSVTTNSTTALDRSGWTVSSSHGYNQAKAIDGQTNSSYTSGTIPTNGMYVQLNLGAQKTFNRLTIDTEVSPNDTIGSYEIYATNDTASWGTPIASGKGSSYIDVSFPSQTKQHVRIVSKESKSGCGCWWTIHELNAYNSSATSNPPASGVLSRTGWTATASTSMNNTNPSQALDGNLASKWELGPQVNGQWYRVDMGSSRTFKEIRLDNSGWKQGNYPRGYEVYVSNDGTNWGTAVASGTVNTTPAGGILTITFPTQTARYVKVVQTGSSTSWWSIEEFYAVN